MDIVHLSINLVTLCNLNQTDALCYLVVCILYISKITAE